MKSVKFSSLVIALFLITGISMFPPSSCTVRAVEQPSLTDEDCVKCHSRPPAAMATSGGKHKGVGCSGCHVGHPPAVKKPWRPFPKCNQCHIGSPHFEITGCFNCHRDPHAPLNIIFTSNSTNACLPCHKSQISQLRQNKSKHSALNCATCHSAHRKVPQCTQCHRPHSPEMTPGDCRNCHKAHMPKVVTYDESVQSKDCGSCHQKAFDVLSSSVSKHRALSCAFCHKGRHKTIPKCPDCHVSPHQKAGIRIDLTKCSECHNIAHYLNRWP